MFDTITTQKIADLNFFDQFMIIHITLKIANKFYSNNQFVSIEIQNHQKTIHIRNI